MKPRSARADSAPAPGEILAWHGSPHRFGRFDFSRLEDGLGAFFSATREHAAHWGEPKAHRLRFANLLRVRQGREYAEKLAPREGEHSPADVRCRLRREGYDGVCIEYDGGAVDYVALVPSAIDPPPSTPPSTVRRRTGKSMRRC